MKLSILPRTFLSFSFSCDIKALPGFVKGGRDKVPKEASDYQNKLIAGWSEQMIKDHIEAVATKSKDNLEISARDFQTPSYDLGSGSFSCKFFNYNFSVAQSDEDASQCFFTGLLEVQNIELFHQAEKTIDDCFDFRFEKATCSLPKNDRDLKELIYSIDDHKKIINEIYDFSYENDFSAFQLVHKINGTLINVNDRGIEVNFKEAEPISKMLNTLNEMNRKIFSKTSELVEGTSI